VRLEQYDRFAAPQLPAHLALPHFLNQHPAAHSVVSPTGAEEKEFEDL